MKALALKENQSAGARGKPKKAGKFPKTGQVDVANQIDNNMLFGVYNQQLLGLSLDNKKVNQIGRAHV